MSFKIKLILIFFYLCLICLFSIYVTSNGIIGKMISYKTTQTSSSIVQSNLFRLYNKKVPQIIIIGNVKFVDFYSSKLISQKLVPLILIQPDLRNIKKILNSLYDKNDIVIIQWFPYFLSNIYHSPEIQNISLFIWERKQQGFKLTQPKKDGKLFFNSLTYLFSDFKKSFRSYHSKNNDLSMISFDRKEKDIKNLLKNISQFKKINIYWKEDFSKFEYNNSNFLIPYKKYINDLKKNKIFKNFEHLTYE